jgi:hypothetical protein
VNFSMRLRHSQNTLNVTDCDGNTSDDVGLSCAAWIGIWP